jgi:hypothetical protein
VRNDDASYSKFPGFPIPGASSNPFCLFPAPAALRLSLISNGAAVSLGTLASYLPKPPADLGPAKHYLNLLVFNGGYKLYNGASHTANSCWSVIQDANSASIKSAANEYAKHLGHV